jgi:hypothetical protein
MKKGKRRARRLALYLSSIGIPPVPSAGSYKQWAAGLQDRYNALEVGQRKLTRRTGRRLFKESGSIAIAIASLANPFVLRPEVSNSPPIAPRTNPDPERKGSTFAGASLCSRRLIPLVGCGTASLRSSSFRFGLPSLCGYSLNLQTFQVRDA